jgi:hypothetical protein
MGFANFVKQVLKTLFGYGGGFLSGFAGIMVFGQGNSVIGAILMIVGFLLVLFGIYSEKGL